MFETSQLIENESKRQPKTSKFSVFATGVVNFFSPKARPDPILIDKVDIKTKVASAKPPLGTSLISKEKDKVTPPQTTSFLANHSHSSQT